MDGSMTEDIIEIARRRMDDAVTADWDNREDALDDLEFLTGVQWPEQVKREREEEGRPILTINRMPQFVRQVTGDIRRTNPAIKVLPGDSDATDDGAEVMAGIIRHIEYRSGAQGIYEGAAESAAACGMGWFRVVPVKNEVGEQDIEILPIQNPFSVHVDPLAKHSTRRDSRFMFVTTEMDMEDFKEEYPGAATEGFEADGRVELLRRWYNGDTITVAEYFWRDGDQIMWAKMSGLEVLEGPTVFPSRHMPVFFVGGEEHHVGNRQVRSSVIRYAKDSQRLYNYWSSALTEIVALQPKAPFIGTTKQFEGHEAEWQNANNNNYPFLPYNADPEAPGAPQRSAPPVSSSGMAEQIMLAAEDMKATTGIYDAALGAKSNEKSGVAIERRQVESDISTSIYVDNLAKSIEQCGRVLVDMIPRIYDTTRIVRVIGEDEATDFVELNVPVMTPAGPAYLNDPSFGMYDVRISTGPSYTSQRQEAADAMLEFGRVYPEALPVMGDLIAKNMDWPGADQIADRLRKLLPPGMAEDGEGTAEQHQIQMLQQQIAQMQEAMAQMAQQPAYRKEMAGAAKAEADATRAGLQVQEQQLENVEKQLELALQRGQLDAAIQNAVARALQGAMPLMGR